MAELGANQGESPLHEAFVVPGTTIYSYIGKLSSALVAKQLNRSAVELRPIADALVAEGVPVPEISARLSSLTQAAGARSADVLPKSNDGADIEAAIASSRMMLKSLNVSGARAVLQAKIEEEDAARVRRLVPLLKERASVERLAHDIEAARSTLTEITRLMPDDVEALIELGELWMMTGQAV
jgi:hypothetical protein